MGWSNSNEDERADYFHDHAKHDFEPLPHRLDRQISTAEDIALCVRALRNLAEGAALIQQFADMTASIALAEAARNRAIGAPPFDGEKDGL